MRPATPLPPAGQPPKLLDRLRATLRLHHCSLRTEEAYAQWARRCILFHRKRHPPDLGAAESNAFLTHLVVRGGKGNKDRRTMRPEAARPPRAEHLRRRQEFHERDLARGYGRGRLPDALARKRPAAVTAWAWPWVFPSATLSRDPRRPEGGLRRHHPHEGTMRRQITAAVRRAGLSKRATSHSFRHSFATHLLEDG